MDEFLSEFISLNLSCTELQKAAKVLLVLSHGQATVEEGFSVNQQVSLQNLKDALYVSQQIVWDVVNKVGFDMID